ncbi:MAG: autotransporter domain-containing protein [Rhodospirillales bacterium]|nr:autotransporter domain-containing protein [Rhodospirillales bacterium]MCB9980300.1 autotransporter domain-containing protein [Rhodospirillales bacterium]
MTNFKKLLLAGTAVVAIGAAPAFAANDEVNPAGAGTAITPGADASVQTDAADDVGEINVNAIANIGDSGDDDTVADEAINIDHTGNEITFYDSDSAATATVTIGDGVNDAAVTMAATTTTTFTIGEDSTGGNANNVNVVFDGAITGAAADSILNINTSATSTNTVSFYGATDLSTGTVTMGNAADTVVLGEADAGANSTVAFTGNVAGKGTLTLTGDDTDAIGHTITGNVGTSTQSLAAVNVGLDNDDLATATDTHTIAGNLYADTVTFTAANNAGGTTIGGTLVLNDSAAAVTAEVGTITTAVAGDGNLSLVQSTNGVSLTVTGDIGTSTAGLRSIAIGDGAGVSAVTLEADGNVYATAITIGDDGANANDGNLLLNGTSAQVVSGTIDGAGGGEGTITVGDGTNASSVTFQGVIGATDIDGMVISAGATATLQADFDATQDAATDVGLDVNGTLAIDSSTTGVDVNVAAGDIDVDGTVSITGDNATTITAASDIFIDGTFTTALESVALTLTSTGDNVAVGGTSDTTLTLGNAVTLNGDLAVSGNTGKTVTLAIKKTSTFDPDTTTVITATGDTVDIDSDGTLKVTLAADTAEFDDGATITVIDSDENVELDNVDTTYAALITSGDVVLQDTAFIDLADNSSTAQDLLITVNVKDASTVLSGTSYNDMADKLLQTITSADTTGGLETARGNVQGAATAAAAQALLEGMAPNVDGSAQTGVVASVTNSALGLTGDRLASLRTGDQTGMAAGNMTHGLKVWGQAFGTTGTQDSRDGVSGYDVDTWGLTVGVDTQTLADDWVWGLAFTYADTAVDSDNAVNTQVDLDTYQIALYGDYKWDAATYINGQIGYGMNKGDQSKTNVGGTGLTANADVDSDVFFARLEAGRDYDMDNGWTLTPIANLNYQHISSDGYTETGTCGTLCLTNVDVENMNSLEAGLGAEASYLHQMADGSFLKPKLHAAYRYDFIGDEVQTTGAFSGVSATRFTVKGFDAQQNTFNVGAGLSFYSSSNFELSANYDYELKEDYDAHNGYIRAGFKF